MKYVRVTIKQNKNKRTFWAILESKGKNFSLYLPVNNEGEDKSYYRKDGVIIIPKELISNDLIIKEEKAEISKKYGTLQVLKGDNNAS